MTTYILILSFWASTLSGGDSVSLSSIEFTSRERCEAAGMAATEKFKTLMKTSVFVCVEK